MLDRDVQYEIQNQLLDLVDEATPSARTKHLMANARLVASFCLRASSILGIEVAATLGPQLIIVCDSHERDKRRKVRIRRGGIHYDDDDRQKPEARPASLQGAASMERVEVPA